MSAGLALAKWLADASRDKAGAIYLSRRRQRELISSIDYAERERQSPFSRYFNQKVSVKVSDGTVWTGTCDGTGRDYIRLGDHTFPASQIIYVKPAK